MEQLLSPSNQGEYFVTQYSQMVKSIANKYKITGYTFDDLYQEGIYALLKVKENTNNIKESVFVYYTVISRLGCLYHSSLKSHHAALNKSSSLDCRVVSDGSTLGELIGEETYEPLSLLIAEEAVREYRKPKTQRKRADILWSNVEVMMDDQGCWEWCGYLQKDSSPIVHANGKRVTALKYYYEKCIGSSPLKWKPSKTCKNKTCVNPYHVVV